MYVHSNRILLLLVPEMAMTEARMISSRPPDRQLRNHARVHTGETPFRCGVCGRHFNRRDKLSRHAKSHDDGARVSCPFREAEGCARSFYRDDKLKEHVAAMHTRSQLYLILRDSSPRGRK